MSDVFWEKGRVTARTARLLLEAGDSDGAVNRAYFAMFHVARAVLAQLDEELARTKRHATVIGRFGRHIVKEGGLSADFGRALSLAFDLRTVADYEPVVVDASEAQEAVESAEAFLGALFARAGRSDE
jgi:uncharacterized protein (UPF0332 family)